MTQMTFTKAVNEFFGKKPGQTLMELQAEIKSLTPEDREYFKREFVKVGIEIVQS